MISPDIRVGVGPASSLLVAAWLAVASATCGGPTEGTQTTAQCPPAGSISLGTRTAGEIGANGLPITSATDAARDMGHEPGPNTYAVVNHDLNGVTSGQEPDTCSHINQAGSLDHGTGPLDINGNPIGDPNVDSVEIFVAP